MPLNPYFFQISFRVFVELSFLDFFSFFDAFLAAICFLLVLDCPHGRWILKMTIVHPDLSSRDIILACWKARGRETAPKG